MRRVWLRGRENIQKRYLLYVAGFNLGLLMRIKTGHGTLKGWASAWLVLIWPNQHPSMAYLAVGMVVEGRCCGIMPIAVICGGRIAGNSYLQRLVRLALPENVLQQLAE